MRRTWIALLLSALVTVAPSRATDGPDKEAAAKEAPGTDGCQKEAGCRGEEARREICNGGTERRGRATASDDDAAVPADGSAAENDARAAGKAQCADRRIAFRASRGLFSGGGGPGSQGGAGECQGDGRPVGGRCGRHQ